MFCSFESGTRVLAVCAAVFAGLVFTGVGRAAPNPACTVQVVVGQSIQAANDGAAPRLNRLRRSGYLPGEPAH